ncbi:MAG TPA: carboxypeptidase-like regulatory domain-containing protein [Longimicrobium sp.]|nr:carboxypeptidase-like regulatory domain-containing protein [Longimicrobium sp.]
MGRFLVGLALAAVLHGPAAAQAGRVIGRVTDGVGNAVADAKVALVAEDTAARVRTGTTGETGGFEFARVEPGRYTVRVERAGYRVREVRVVLPPGGRETLVARLGTVPRRERLADDREQPAARPR